MADIYEGTPRMPQGNLVDQTGAYRYKNPIDLGLLTSHPNEDGIVVGLQVDTYGSQRVALAGTHADGTVAKVNIQEGQLLTRSPSENRLLEGILAELVQMNNLLVWLKEPTGSAPPGVGGATYQRLAGALGLVA